MATIGFIGLGNMGVPMAANLVKAGHRVIGYDINTSAGQALDAPSVAAAASAGEAARGIDVVITMPSALVAQPVENSRTGNVPRPMRTEPRQCHTPPRFR